ncbi:hypothetical protein AAFF_G00206470 [Aldrovandia affinis]|uniref:Uncharacterized protein n=1 Tax=Aldrovandia affinis TaxID=143900 RepID=A0AAD7RHR1_9TELE|nr:hypothetical protein AAFF_G00206470 [Aldrovandia affinis]
MGTHRCSPALKTAGNSATTCLNFQLRVHPQRPRPLLSKVSPPTLPVRSPSITLLHPSTLGAPTPTTSSPTACSSSDHSRKTQLVLRFQMNHLVNRNH